MSKSSTARRWSLPVEQEGDGAETTQCAAVRRNARAVCARGNFRPRASLTIVKVKFCPSDVSVHP